MAVELQVFQNKSSKFRQDVILGTVSVTLSFQWNTRSGAWFVSITDGTNELLSKKLVANWPLLRRNKSFFPTITGDIIAFKTDEDTDDEITYDNLNNGWTLYFLSASEIATWEEVYGV